ADEELAAVDDERSGEGAEEPLGQHAGVVGRRETRRADDELVAPHAGDRVAGPGVPHEALGHLAEDLVAGQVAEAIVDLLEPVEVEHEDGRVGQAAPRLLHGKGKAVAEQQLVGRTGERIVERLVADLVDERRIVERRCRQGGDRVEQGGVLRVEGLHAAALGDDQPAGVLCPPIPASNPIEIPAPPTRSRVPHPSRRTTPKGRPSVRAMTAETATPVADRKTAAPAQTATDSGTPAAWRSRSVASAAAVAARTWPLLKAMRTRGRRRSPWLANEPAAKAATTPVGGRTRAMATKKASSGW